MFSYARLCITALLIVTLTGCASIVSESEYPVNFTSTTNNVSFVITDADGKVVYQGTPPTTVTLKADSGYFSKARYRVKWTYADGKVKETMLTASIDSWYFGNAFFLGGGLIGVLIVDPLTGGMWKLPEAYNDTYATVVSQIEGKPKEQQVSFVNIESIPMEQRSKLVPVM